MADPPPVIEYRGSAGRRPGWHAVPWLLLACDLGLGLGWLAAAMREFFASGADGSPHPATEALRWAFIGLTWLTAAAWAAKGAVKGAGALANRMRRGRQ